MRLIRVIFKPDHSNGLAFDQPYYGVVAGELYTSREQAKQVIEANNASGDYVKIQIIGFEEVEVEQVTGE